MCMDLRRSAYDTAFSRLTLSIGHIADSDQEEGPEEDLRLSYRYEETIVGPEDIEAIETDESAPTSVPSPRRRTARMSIRPQIPMSDTTEALIAEYASTSTPPSPPPSPLSSPLLRFPHHLPTYHHPLLLAYIWMIMAPMGYKAPEIWLIVASPPTHHPSEIPSPPLLLPSTTHIDDLPEADMPL
ncbi:hypothetical protein Tco_0037705 [Tanacetum coccineum]